MIIHTKHIKHTELIFMNPAYLSLKWVGFKEIFVYAPSSIHKKDSKTKVIIQFTIKLQLFVSANWLFLLYKYLYFLFWKFDENNNENWQFCSIFNAEIISRIAIIPPGTTYYESAGLLDSLSVQWSMGNNYWSSSL